jgi:hypothetical protein
LAKKHSVVVVSAIASGTRHPAALDGDGIGRQRKADGGDAAGHARY